MKEIGFILEGLSVVLGTPETNLAAIITLLFVVKVPFYERDFEAADIVVKAETLEDYAKTSKNGLIVAHLVAYAFLIN